MTVLMERDYTSAPAQWRATTFFATTADARTQIGTCWQVATELPQVDPALAGNERRLRLMESLRRLLDALAYLDVDVLDQGRRNDDMQAQRYRHRYGEAYAQMQRATLAADDLLSDISQGPSFQPNAHVLRQAMTRLRRHLDDLGRVVTGPDAKIA